MVHFALKLLPIQTRLLHLLPVVYVNLNQLCASAIRSLEFEHRVGTQIKDRKIGLAQ